MYSTQKPKTAEQNTWIFSWQGGKAIKVPTSPSCPQFRQYHNTPVAVRSSQYERVVEHHHKLARKLFFTSLVFYLPMVLSLLAVYFFHFH